MRYLPKNPLRRLAMACFALVLPILLGEPVEGSAVATKPTVEHAFLIDADTLRVVVVVPQAGQRPATEAPPRRRSAAARGGGRGFTMPFFSFGSLVERSPESGA